jgi:hypothetical protein
MMTPLRRMCTGGSTPRLGVYARYEASGWRLADDIPYTRPNAIAR